MTRRRINPAWKQWKAALVQLRKIRRRTRDMTTPHGEKWTYNMVAHYDRLEVKALANEPEKYLA